MFKKLLINFKLFYYNKQLDDKSRNSRYWSTSISCSFSINILFEILNFVVNLLYFISQLHNRLGIPKFQFFHSTFS